jgi:hypothetical protein
MIDEEAVGGQLRVVEWQLVSNLNQTRIRMSFHSLGGRCAPQISFFEAVAYYSRYSTVSQSIISKLDYLTAG